MIRGDASCAEGPQMLARRRVCGVTPSARGRRECLKLRSSWVHVRLCRTCGAHGLLRQLTQPPRQHFDATGHPVIQGYDPPKHWGWCYVDEVWLDLSDRLMPRLAPIRRYI